MGVCFKVLTGNHNETTASGKPIFPLLDSHEPFCMSRAMCFIRILIQAPKPADSTQTCISGCALNSAPLSKACVKMILDGELMHVLFKGFEHYHVFLSIYIYMYIYMHIITVLRAIGCKCICIPLKPLTFWQCLQTIGRRGDSHMCH